MDYIKYKLDMLNGSIKTNLNKLKKEDIKNDHIFGNAIKKELEYFYQYKIGLTKFQNNDAEFKKYINKAYKLLHEDLLFQAQTCDYYYNSKGITFGKHKNYCMTGEIQRVKSFKTYIKTYLNYELEDIDFENVLKKKYEQKVGIKN